MWTREEKEKISKENKRDNDKVRLGKGKGGGDMMTGEGGKK